jgi:SAM-dependent methyltransferase
VFELAGPMSGTSLLDAGTGDGSYAIEAAARGAEVTGLDIDPAMLAAAKERARVRAVQPHFVEGRIEALPFAAASFDVVLAITALCFIADPIPAVRELARVLRPGGTLVEGDLARYSVWAVRRRVRGWLGSPTWRSAHFRCRGELRRAMAAAGLQVVAIRGGVYFPHCNYAAQVLTGFDRWLSRRNVPTDSAEEALFGDCNTKTSPTPDGIGNHITPMTSPMATAMSIAATIRCTVVNVAFVRTLAPINAPPQAATTATTRSRTSLKTSP